MDVNFVGKFFFVLLIWYVILEFILGNSFINVNIVRDFLVFFLIFRDMWEIFIIKRNYFVVFFVIDVLVSK